MVDFEGSCLTESDYEVKGSSRYALEAGINIRNIPWVVNMHFL